MSEQPKQRWCFECGCFRPREGFRAVGERQGRYCCADCQRRIRSARRTVWDEAKRLKDRGAR
jgi:hypothetical protein